MPSGEPSSTGRSGALEGLSPDQRGALIYLATSLVFICTDSLAKVVVSSMPLIPVLFGRNLAYVVAVVILMGRGSPARLLRTSRLRAQVTRGLLMFGSTAAWFWGLSLLPIAEMSALSSTAPLMTIALAGPLLGERVSRAAVVGAIIGFGGVLVLVGVDGANVQLAMLLPLANAAILAVFFLLTRDLREEPASVTMFWSGVVPLAASTLLFVAIPSTGAVSPEGWLGIAVVGLMALAAHRPLVGAYRWGRASILAPMGYLGVLWAFLVGALVFSEPLTLQGVLGGLGIATGGIIALRASNANPDQQPTPASTVAVPVLEADEAGPFGEAVTLDQPSSPAR